MDKDVKQKFRRKRIPSTQRLPTSAVKKQLIDEMGEMTRTFMRIVATSQEPVDKKEKLADFFLFVLNVLDIENEKLSYEKIECQKPKRNRRALPKV